MREMRLRELRKKGAMTMNKTLHNVKVRILCRKGSIESNVQETFSHELNAYMEEGWTVENIQVKWEQGTYGTVFLSAIVHGARTARGPFDE